MQGLDNYLADGAKAFDELISVIDKLSEIGLEGNIAAHLKESLKEGKQYLKGDFKVLIYFLSISFFQRTILREINFGVSFILV